MSRTKRSLEAEEKFLIKVSERGGRLLSPYKNSKEKVSVMCENGHIFEARPHHITGDSLWCKSCPSKGTLLIFEELKRKVSEKKGTILGELIKGSEPVLLRCENNHTWKMTPIIICKTQRWCPECEKILNIPYETIVRNTIDYRNGKLISPYKNTRGIKLIIECEESHKFEIRPSAILKGTWCNYCLKSSPAAFKSRLEQIVAEKKGELLTPYISTKSVITIMCDNEHVWTPYPGHIVNDGSWCPHCPTNISLQSQENFMNVIAEKGGILISDYVNNNTKVRIRCNKGHEWNVTPHSIAGKMSSWCPFCSDNSPEQTSQRFYDKVAEYEGKCLGVYRSVYSRVLVQCKNNHVWKCVPHDIISRYVWCSKCYGNCPAQAREKFYQIIAQKQGQALEPYINTSSRVKIRCVNGHEWDAIPGSINHGSWCRACNATCPKEAYKNLCAIVADNNGTILEDYINSNTKIAFKCKNDHIFRTCPANITNSGTWCPSCKESHGERHVRRVLEKYSISFRSQKEHPDLPKYYFDFYFNINNKEFYLEYDGEQHFRHVEFFSKTSEDYEHRRNIDVLKSRAVNNSEAYLIRLDNTLSSNEIEQHILNAINGSDKIYFSDSSMYKWIIDGIKISPTPRIITLNMNTSDPLLLHINAPYQRLTLKIIKDDSSTN